MSRQATAIRVWTHGLPGKSLSVMRRLIISRAALSPLWAAIIAACARQEVMRLSDGGCSRFTWMSPTLTLACELPDACSSLMAFIIAT